MTRPPVGQAMTQGKHTPGRLIVESCIDGIGFYVASEQIEYDAVCDCSDWDNATRLAAAWNACEGIPTEALEAGVVKDMLELHKENARILGYLCDELQGIVEAGKLGALSKCCDRSLSAIAKATGEKP